MVNASLNWASIVGIILAIWGLISAPLAITQIVMFLQKNNKDSTSILKTIYIFLVTPLRFIGSLFVGFVIAKRLSFSKEKIILSGFCSCFTSFTGFIYFLYKIINQGDWIKFIIFFNLIIIVNLFTMYVGFWVSRKIT